jgi:DNA-binding beta-propeller fold protein YncE/tetratricopeptide (TPR) repeat protein
VFTKRFFSTSLVACAILLGSSLPLFAYQQIEFIHELGDYKKPEGQRMLNGPRALALGGDRLFIADTEAHRVVVLDPSGKTLLAWGSKGDAAGQFKYPSGIALDEQGKVYVVDGGNGRIQIFDQAGKFVRMFGSKGSGPKQFSDPSGIVVAKGMVYVADTGNSRVQVFSSDGIFLSQVTYQTEKDEMKAPVDLAVDVQNKLYVLDPVQNNVRVFDPAGKQVLVFGAKGGSSDGFDEPRGLAVDGSGNIFVADSDNYKFKKFDAAGKLQGSLGTEGDGPGQFRRATGIKVDADDKVYVLDAKKNTLQVFACEAGTQPPLAPASPLPAEELSGVIAETVSSLAFNKGLWGITKDSLGVVGVAGATRFGVRGDEPGMLKNSRGMAADDAGNIWVADTDNDRIQKFSSEGALLHVIGKSGSGEGQFDGPSGIALSPKGNLCVADTGNNRVQVFSAKGMFLGAFGKSGSLRGQFKAPVDLTVDRAGNIYVVDRGNNKFGKYDGNGALLWESGKEGSADGEFDRPENILVSPDNEVYVLDAGNARVQVFDSSGKFLRKFGSPGRGPGEFKAPLGLALEAGVRLSVGDAGNNRVQTFTLRHTPAVPQDMTAQPRPNEIQVNWKPNAETFLDHYTVYRAESAAGPFKAAGVTKEPFFTDKNLPSNKTFFYAVTSQAREGNESALSLPASAATPRLVPATPRKISIGSLEKQITLSWTPNTEPFMSSYRVYRSKHPTEGFEPVAKVEKTLFVDAPLADETLYYYKLTSVGKEGDESPASDVVFTTTPKAAQSLPPLEIAKVEIGEIFSSSYKYYESHSIGTVIIRNNSGNPFSAAKLSFSIKDYMDYPSEIQLQDIAAGQEIKLDLKPVFSNKILEVTENTPIQSELALTYYIAGEARSVTRSFPITLYERHAMLWDQKAKLGAYVTPKDPPVVEFSRSVVQQYVDAYPNLHSSLVYARGIYGALGVLGINYIVDPTSPFQQFSENATSVDYLQYPRDTLSRKSGDCDDLSILFAACLENIGVGTAFIDVPGHVFIMFNTGVTEKDRMTLGFPEELLVRYQGTVWIPVEMTMVGSSFTRAWQKAAEEYRDWAAKGKAEIIVTQKSWELFKPVTLPGNDIKVGMPKRQEIDARFADELETLGRQRLNALSAGYIELLKKNPEDLASLTELGIVYGENGLHAEALQQFQKMLALDKANAVALNNIGNISFLQERLEDAKQAYESSLQAAPDDPGIMVNLSRVLLRLGKKEEAKKLFQQAASLDPRIIRQNSDLASDLGVVK